MRASDGSVAPHSEHRRMGLFARAARRLSASSTACLLIPSVFAAADGETPESTSTTASWLLDISLSIDLDAQGCNTSTLSWQVRNVTMQLLSQEGEGAMKTEVTISTNPDTRELHVQADQCDGALLIPADVELTDRITLSALAIIALTPMARKIVAHMPWFGEVVGDQLVRDFVEKAYATYSPQEQPDSPSHGEDVPDQAPRPTRRGLQRQTVLSGTLCITHSDNRLSVEIGGRQFCTNLPDHFDELSDEEALGFAALAMMPLVDDALAFVDLPPEVCKALAIIERYTNDSTGS